MFYFHRQANEKKLLIPLLFFYTIFNDRKIYVYNIIVNYLEYDITEKRIYLICIPLFLFINQFQQQTNSPKTYFILFFFYRKWDNERLLISPFFIVTLYWEVYKGTGNRKCKILF
jgi:hypothetical protein